MTALLPARPHLHRLEYWLPVLLALAWALFGSPPRAAGQVIRGTLVEQDFGTPIEGAAILLLDADGMRVAWTLTDAAGRFFFSLDVGGRYILRAERIGHASTTSDGLDIAGGETLVYRMEARVEPIQLSELKVEGTSRNCRIRPEEGVATARVWEETRKALEAAARTAERGVYQFVLRFFDRTMDDRGETVLSETSRVGRRFRRRPFRSLEASKLIEEGFVQPDGDGSFYYAPDADVLLSDVFLDTHCFRLREGKDEHEGLLGLEFEPTRNRDVSEISGTLWIDPSNAELQRLEYRYEKLGFSVGRSPVGGTLIFAGLPNGTWFIKEWSIRMPILGREPRATRTLEPLGGLARTASPARVVGIKEEGALVLGVRDSSGNVVVDSEGGTITGVVLNNALRPVGGATVHVAGTDQTENTQDDGLFRLGLLGDGTYELVVNHPDLASLGYRGARTPVQATAGQVRSVRLYLPDRWRVLDEGCDDRDPDEGGIVAGWIEHAETGQAVRGASVQVTWTEWEFEGGQRVNERRTSVEMTSREDGFFIVCGAPVDTAISVLVQAVGMSQGHETVRLGRKGDLARPIVKMRPMDDGS